MEAHIKNWLNSAKRLHSFTPPVTSSFQEAFCIWIFFLTKEGGGDRFQPNRQFEKERKTIIQHVW